MAIPAFQESELTVVRENPGRGGAPGTPVYDFPVLPREGYLSFMHRKPIWQVIDLGVETTMFSPWIIPDNIARAFCYDGTFVPGVTNQTGGKDMFGLDWTFVPEVGGSITAPGNPSFDDANDIVDGITWPNIDEWDWEKCAADNKDYIGNAYKTNAIDVWWLNGWFERLISMMDFAGAAVALIDEDQQPGVHKFFEKLTELYIACFDKIMHYWPEIDIFYIHDDWSSQKDTFFAPDVAKEMLVPYLKETVAHLHAAGKICEFHSCGNGIKQIPNMIEIGFDFWNPQPMVDTWKAYDEYGDDILIGVVPQAYDAANSSETEQREQADAFVEKFCNPAKPAVLNFSFGPSLTNAYREELYRKSRIAFGA